MLVHQMWEKHADESVVYRYHDQSVTYGDLNNNVKKIRDYYYTIGVRPGENVGLYCKNCPDFVYAYFAIVSMGAVVVPINKSLTAHEVEFIAKDANMKYIVTMESLELESTFQQLIIPEYNQEIGSITLEESPIANDIDEEEVAVIIYTSGTTGHPKGAMLTHKNLVSNSDGIAEALDITVDDRILCVLPMFHSFAWTTTVLSALYCGATTIILENFHPKDTLKTISGEKATIVCGVPTMYNYYLMLGTPELFISIKYFVSGGASLPVEITENFRAKFNLSIVEGYGLSEASPVVTVNPLDDVRVGSIGVPLKNIEVKILNTENQELANGEIGELVVKGPNVMKGYYNLPEVTKKTIVDNWLYTGDVAYKNDEGYIYIVDRLKDIVIVSGMNVYPREVEEVIYQYEGVVEATVIGIPDKTRGEVTAAYIATKDNENFDLKLFKDFLRANLAGFKLPRKVMLMDELPKNATGKIVKKVLREEYSKK